MELLENQEFDEAKAVSIMYTNYKGVTGERKILPGGMWFGESDWYKTKQWFLRAYDLERNEIRDFAMANISDWSACK